MLSAIIFCIPVLLIILLIRLTVSQNKQYAKDKIQLDIFEEKIKNIKTLNECKEINELLYSTFVKNNMIQCTPVNRYRNLSASIYAKYELLRTLNN